MAPKSAVRAAISVTVLPGSGAALSPVRQAQGHPRQRRERRGQPARDQHTGSRRERDRDQQESEGHFAPVAHRREQGSERAVDQKR